jgi:hypothetical protein
LSSTDLDVVEQAVKGLTHMTGHSGPHRRYISIQLGIIESLFKLVVSETPLSLRRELADLLMAFSGDVHFTFGLNEFEKLLPVFKRLLHEEDKDVLIRALWGIYYVVGNMGGYPQLIVDAGVNDIKLFLCMIIFRWFQFWFLSSSMNIVTFGSRLHLLFTPFFI